MNCVMCCHAELHSQLYVSYCNSDLLFGGSLLGLLLAYTEDEHSTAHVRVKSHLSKTVESVV